MTFYVLKGSTCNDMRPYATELVVKPTEYVWKIARALALKGEQEGVACSIQIQT